VSRSHRYEWRRQLTAAECPATSTQRLVGLLLAEYMNGDATAWPSIATLAERTGLSDRAVQNALHALVELRFLAVAREGKGHSTTYQAILPTSAPGADLPRHVVPTSNGEGRHLTTRTSAPDDKTSARRAPELLRSGKNLRATAQVGALAGAPPAADQEHATCPFCGEVFHGIGTDALNYRSGHVAEEHRDVLPQVTSSPLEDASCEICDAYFDTDIYRFADPEKFEPWQLCIGCAAILRHEIAPTEIDVRYRASMEGRRT
jgi:hypothetical protein